MKTTTISQLLFATGIALALAASSGPAAAGAGEAACGSLTNAYGPFDYRTERQHLQIVENFHFTPEVESLMRGKSGSLGGDLDYTLRASPNHHRALLALMRLGKRSPLPQPADLPRPIDCYFDRALRFQRDDPIPRMIYARFLVDKGRMDEARQQLAATARLAEANAMTHYNVGLIYAEMKDYPSALEQAHVARRLGHTATGLQDQLKAAGQWREPAADTERSPAKPAQ